MALHVPYSRPFLCFCICCFSLLGGVVVREKESEMEERSRLEFIIIIIKFLIGQSPQA